MAAASSAVSQENRAQPRRRSYKAPMKGHQRGRCQSSAQGQQTGAYQASVSESIDSLQTQSPTADQEATEDVAEEDDPYAEYDQWLADAWGGREAFEAAHNLDSFDWPFPGSGYKFPIFQECFPIHYRGCDGVLW
ncbi:hypothetical protein PsorP6_008914 [Peronosclerospora sorghi]|uniref:Uncharacterized protein n=1 Tax=Peronosclerospora sorghi TaxID=230839 RepID=A0ACC0VZQ7_9STRA|nr:hypothetical protein PsorP6_008914 [Peronosclerospora sorghi]